ncbi:MAG: (d)CMP kinase [Anaerolineae bacterium]|nr:(d)CMP kinase [Anaerolineae bacterium]
MTDSTNKKRKKTISTITIDGPAASGKSTIGELLAERLGYIYFDTGVIYRAVTWAALQRNIPISDEAALAELAEGIKINVTQPTVKDGRQYTVYADGEDVTWKIRRPEVEDNVSPVSAYPKVRKALLAQQRRIAEKGNIVMVGRDIGTVVLPNADLKIYLDASVEERARRRYKEILARGEPSDYGEVLRHMQRRDEIDSKRETAPLRPAADAIIIDTTEMSIQEVLNRVEEIIKERSRDCGLLNRFEGAEEHVLPRNFWFHHFVNRILRWVARVLLRYEIRGLERVPRQGPLLIIINHINFLDAPLATIFLPRDIILMTKAENLRKPIFAQLIKWYGVFPVQRGEVDRTALRNALRVLQEGYALLIAPEGTRSGHGRLQRARNGMAYVALKSGAPILPIAIWGGESFWRNLRRLRKTHVEIEIGEPFVLQAKEGERIRRAELTQMTNEAMWRLAALLPPKYRGVYGNPPETPNRYLKPYRAREEEKAD